VRSAVAERYLARQISHDQLVASSYDNRFISVVTIEGRKIVQWQDYMDSLAAMTALSQVQ
jgi:ketosteroid isomerase-like protein